VKTRKSFFLQQYVDELKRYMNTKNLRDLKLDEPETGGYTFVTLAVAFWALRQRDMRTAIETLVMEAGSAAGNCAVAGAMLGCKLGMQGIPAQWLAELKKRDWLEAKINR
jgi:ADP-ribosylglycohydrolase